MKDILPSIINTLSEWIAIKSVKTAPEENAPFGAGINLMLEKALADARAMGFCTKNYSGYIGEVVFGDGEDKDGVAVLCHLDVVPEGDLNLWSFPPYSLTEKDGYLYGRGVLDDKAPAVLCLYALKRLKDEGFKPSKKIKLIFGLDEESGWSCIDYYNKVATMPKMGFSPDGDFPVIYAEKGILHVKYSFNANENVETVVGGDRINVVCDSATVKLKSKRTRKFKGVSAHGSTPQKGENAIKKALNYLVKKGCFLEQDFENLFSGRLFYKIEDESGNLTFSPNVINLENGKINVWVDVRYPVHYTLNDIEKLLRKVGDFEIVSHHAPLYADKNGKLVKTLLKVYENCFNESGKPITTGGGTYARALKNGVAFGPSLKEESCCHMPNEKISVEILKKCFDAYKQAIYELAK